MYANLTHGLSQKLDELYDTHQWMESEILHRVVQRVREGDASHRQRRIHIITIADRFNDALAPYTACRKGCSHCCHMPAMIYTHEAESLADASGRTMASVEHRLVNESLDSAARFSGQACPFLAGDGSCSAYDARPLICRLHHSLNESPNNCRLGPTGHTKPVVRYDPVVIERHYHQLMLEKTPSEAWASIHEFFPSDLPPASASLP